MTDFAYVYNIKLSKPMKLTTILRGILKNLPHLLEASLEPGSSVPYDFWTLSARLGCYNNLYNLTVLLGRGYIIIIL